MSKKAKLALVLALVIFLVVLGAACVGTTHCKPVDNTTANTTTPDATTATGQTLPPTDLEINPTEGSMNETLHVHEYETTVIAPTCTDGGFTTYKCKCGETHDGNYIDALGHDYVITIIDPTYTEQGYSTYNCSVCNHSYYDNFKDPIPHDCDYTEDVVKPTCTQKGYITKTCKLCGKSFKCDETEMVPHKYVQKVTNPTCTSKGYTTHTCSCGKSYKDSETDMIPHQYTDDIIAPTCTDDGYTVHTCKSCGYEYKDAIVAKVSHVFGSYKSDGNAKCESDGTKTAKCKSCDATDTVTAPGTALGHSMSGWKSYDEIKHTRACTRAGCEYNEEESHRHDQTTVIEPTCTEKGYTNTSCICGHGGQKTNFIDALGHDYKTKTIAPTYTEEGYDEHTCTRCKDVYKDNYVSKIPHDCSYDKKVTNPTCVDKGYTTYTCRICVHTYIADETEAIGHDYKTTTKEPTCTEKGYNIHECKRCGATYTSNDVDPIGHNYTTSTVEATTGWGGYDYHQCKTCGHSYKDNETDKLPEDGWPKGYSDSTCTIIIYKEWHENAWVYAAHIKFTDYDRLWMECANGKYNSGGETTSHAAKRVGAILAINGDYAVPSNGAGGYAIARKGVVYNDKKAYPEGVYNSNTGILSFGHSGKMLSELVAEGKVTDTFQFGPNFLQNGKIIGDPNSNSRAQRTFIGTNGNAGDIWLCVSDGRYNDGVSSGLNAYQCATYLQSKGCTLGVPLDGGGSSTIYFNGKVLNAAKSGQRAVVDFLVFK
jgi:exopolysaccharide biosynthesis protein